MPGQRLATNPADPRPPRLPPGPAFNYHQLCPQLECHLNRATSTCSLGTCLFLILPLLAPLPCPWKGSQFTCQLLQQKEENKLDRKVRRGDKQTAEAAETSWPVQCDYQKIWGKRRKRNRDNLQRARLWDNQGWGGEWWRSQQWVGHGHHKGSVRGRIWHRFWGRGGETPSGRQMLDHR